MYRVFLCVPEVTAYTHFNIFLFSRSVMIETKIVQNRKHNVNILGLGKKKDKHTIKQDVINGICPKSFN